jgi:hypothetical protein
VKTVQHITLFIFCLFPCFELVAQDTTLTRKQDTSIVFGKIEIPSSEEKQTSDYSTSWGINVLVAPSGFGLGTFIKHDYTNEISGFIDFSISDVKDDNEVEYYDIYGNSFTPGKVNRFLMMPLYVGIQKRMFKDEILDNFRPCITAAMGPTMIYVFPYDMEYFSAIGKGRLKYTLGGYIGLGAFFGSERSSIVGLNLRYYFVPYPAGLESMQSVMKKEFGGFFVTLSFGSSW